METIVIDDLPLQDGSPGTIIDLDDENSNDDVEILEVRQPTIEEQFPSIIKENKVLADLIEKCIELDEMGAMKRVMKRTLIPLYQDTTEVFKKSVQFERALTKVVTKIETDPTHKFSHVREFCLFLKDNKDKKIFTKKKVDFVTLSNNVKAKSKKTHHKTPKRRIKRRKVDSVIDLVDDEYEVPIINLDEQVCYLPSYVLDGVPATVETNHYNEKENENTNIAINDNDRNIILEKQSIEADKANSLTNRNNNVYLEARSNYLPKHDYRTDEDKIHDKINDIEQKIMSFKILADKLDEKEVTVDSYSSPYLQSEYYHKKIVKLYKELCQLTGHEPVKRREVRLKATDSRCELPLKKLQALVNDNIKEDGLPHFPDFEEVVQCFWEASSEGDLNLNWCSTRIMYEARALFTYLGRALQRSRQRREWRDMLRIVKNELLDPADTDPELAAKLERNRIISREREYDVLDRFAALEKLPLEPISNHEIQVEQSDDDDEEITEQPQIKISQVFSHRTLQPNAIITPVLNDIEASVTNDCGQTSNISHPPITASTSQLGTCEGLFLSINTSTETIQFNAIRKSIDSSQKDFPSLPNTHLSENVVYLADVNEAIIENNITVEGSQKNSNHGNIPSASIVNNIMAQSSNYGSRNLYSDTNINEADSNKDIQNILADNTASSTRIEVLSIEIENNADEEMQEPDVNVEKDVHESMNEPVIERQHETNTVQTECNKSADTNQIESEDVQSIKIENNLDEEMQEPDDKVEMDVNESMNEPIVERQDETNTPQSNCNKSSDTDQIELEEVLRIEIENNLDEGMQEPEIKVEKDVNESMNEPIVERKDETNTPQTECNKSADTDQIESEDVKVKTERTVEDLLRQLNEMDDSSLTATIIDIIDPFLVIEISSDSDSDEEEDTNKVSKDSATSTSALTQDKT